MVYAKQSKNVLIINILQILEKYSDVSHRLTQNDIVKLLDKDYDMQVERKSIIRNINNLIEAGYDIGFDEKSKGKGKNKTEARTNFYIERDFDDSELRFLIDGITNMRIDWIKDVEILDEKIDDSIIINDKNVPKHMLEHIYMMSGESELVTFEFNEKILTYVLDWFGYNIDIKKSSKKDMLTANTLVNVNAMRFWALQYGENVVVKSPKKLVDTIKSQIKDMSKKYR